MYCNDGSEYQREYSSGYGAGGYGSSPYDNRSVRKFYPVVTWVLLAANILFFIYLEWRGSTDNSYFMVQNGSMVPALVVEWGQYYRLFTAFFMHFGFSHLFNNMLLLWYLGIRLEKYMGHIPFAVTYLVCGLGGNAASLIYYMLTDPYINSAGASGAVFGVVGAMLWIVLRHRGRLADLTTRQLMLMILFTLYNGFTGSGINNAAHIAGVVLGFLLGMIFYRGGQSIRSWKRKQREEDVWYDLS